ncbi:unnamed protein product [Polarella glacialis]|uniref:FHA domain-containing protein n=1 Tax=Polarella glacialis TaxID=89957 RepID=A0A813DHV4_POLGL|nr:unnamed protein product [Polarella glacialis]
MDAAAGPPVAVLIRTEGAPQSVPAVIIFSQPNSSISVGRAETNQVALNDRKISKAHALLTLKTCKRKGAADGEVMRRVFIKDSSTFGTFINGKALKKGEWTIVNEGDAVGLRNPHGNPAGGEYIVYYQDVLGKLAAATAQGEVPVSSVASSEPNASAKPQKPQKPKASLPKPRVKQEVPEIRPSQVKQELGQDPDAAAEEPPSPASLISEAEDEAAPAAAGDAEDEDMAEPLSPLSEVSEISAPDEDFPASTMPGAPPGLLPGMMPGMPPGMMGMPGMMPGMMMSGMTGMMPGMMMPGMHGMLGMPGMPGMPFGMQSFPGAPGFPLLPPGFAPPSGPMPNAALPGARPPGGKGAAGSTLAVAAKPIVMTVGAEFVGTLIGRGGEVVKQLSQESGARIEISKTAGETAATSGERTVHISGTQDCIDKAKKLIEETIDKAKEKTGGATPNACTLKVPHELIGMLIGRGGETIKELKKESGARIDINKEPAEDNSTDRMVHISGPPECVEYAKKMIEEMLGKSRERLGIKEEIDDKDEGKPAVVDVATRPSQMLVLVPNELIGMLIGKGGETIRNISKDCGVRIEIVKDEASDRADERAVNISGPPDCLDKAKRLIDDTLNRSREKRSGGDRDDSRPLPRSGGDRDDSRPLPAGARVIKVEDVLIGVLIGRGGETISKLQRDTGARIEISKDDRDSSERSVTISGPPEAVKKAVIGVEEVLSGARDKEGRGGGRRGPDRGRDREQLSLPAPGDEGALALLGADGRRGASPIKDSYVCEKLYVDEVEMTFRPSFMPEHEDGLPTDLEIFIRGLPKAMVEKDLWEHLYRLGATDVKEILLLRRQKQSKGMAYVVFNRHDHAVIAKQKLQNMPSSTLTCSGQVQSEEQGHVTVRFSESERCINGRGNAYGVDMIGLLLGSRGKCVEQVKERSGLRKVQLTGRSMKSYGSVDEDPRLHMVVYYEPEEVDNVAKAIEVWGDQLGAIHRELVDKGKGKGGFKGKGKGWPEWDPMMPLHPMWGPPPPMGIPMGPPMGPPMAGPPPPEPPVEAPVLLMRRKLAPPQDGQPPTMIGEKVCEATSLRGRELRWQPWPEVTKFNGDWKVTPLRWGLRGELFVLLRRRNTGEIRVCAAEVQQPMEKWPMLYGGAAGAAPSKATRYKSFTFNEHLFVISIDREMGHLKVSHVPDPSSAWDAAFETTLPDQLVQGDEAFPLTRNAKLCIIYGQDRVPFVVAVEPTAAKGEQAARVFRISDPGKPWKLCGASPALSPKVRLLPVYTKARSPNMTDFEAALFSVDAATHELSIFQAPVDMEKPWQLISKLPFPGDTRLSCIYVPGKPEPLLMAGSPTERMQKLCHLNLIDWRASKQDERLPPPKAPVVEEKFSRPMSSLWPENSREGHDPQSVVALPMDCTADLPVSKHTWAMMPVLPSADAPPGPMPPMGPRPPFDYGPPQYPGAPPFDPRMPPPFDFRPPPFGRPPFDRPPPPGWFPGGRPPFDLPPGAQMPPMPPFERPPMPLPPFDDRRPPFEGRPPFEAPPGDWFGKGKGGAPPGPPPPGSPPGAPPPGVGPGPEVGSMVEANSLQKNQWLRAKVIAKHPDGTFDVEYDGDYMEWHVPANRLRPSPGAVTDGAEADGHRRRRHRHRRGGEEGGEGEGRKRRRGENAGEDGEAVEAEAEAEGDAAAPPASAADANDADADATEAPTRPEETPAEGDDGAAEGRKRHRRHHRTKDPDQERSKSQDGERKTHRRRRHRDKGDEEAGVENGAPASGT